MLALLTDWGDYRMRWNLSNIYPSFDSESFKNDLQRIDKELSGFLNWMDENLINEGNGLEAKLEYVINKLNELSLLAGKLYNYASLTLSANANDETAAKYLDIIRSKFVNLSLARTKLRKFLKNVEIDFSNLKSETLKSHKFFIEEQKILSKYLLSENEEKIISLMRLTGGNAWNNLYEKTTSNLLCEVEINGELKKLPLMRVRNMAYDESAEIRKKAYEAELKACENASQVVAQCLNSIKGEFLTEVNLRGYSSPLEPMLMENRISKETFDAMMSAVKGSMPILRKYLRKKAELLGHKNGLPWYDLFAPIGGYNKKWSFDEARKFIVEKLSNFSDELVG